MDQVPTFSDSTHIVKQKPEHNARNLTVTIRPKAKERKNIYIYLSWWYEVIGTGAGDVSKNFYFIVISFISPHLSQKDQYPQVQDQQI